MPVPQQPAEQDLDTIQHPLYGTLKFPKTMGMDQRNQIIDNLAPAGSPKGGPPIPAAHPPVNMRSGLDEISNVTPEQRAGHNGLINAAQDYGANVIGSTAGLLAHPAQSAKGMIKSMDMSNIGPALTEAKEHPELRPPLSQAIPAGLGQATGAYLSGEAGIGAGKGLIKGVDAIPRTGRAAATLSNIEKQAANVPVSMTKTQPALGEFSESVKTGGKNAPVMTKLANRITPPAPKSSLLGNMQNELNGTPEAPPPQPINFPEARDFYSNISRATAKPGMLRRAIESPGAPAFRYNAGGVRQALNSDLVDAANSIGRGEDYTGAMNEFRRGSQLNSIAKKAAIGAGAGAIGYSNFNKLKNLIPLLLMFITTACFGQAVRYNGDVYTINASAPLPGALYPVLASTSATINICLAPATGFTVLNAATQSISTGCTNFAPTFTNAAQSGTCSFPTQLTRTNSTTCVKTVDAEGGFGAWMVSGTYQYTITLSYGSFGPYDFSVGGSGGGGGGSLLLQHNGANLARQDLLNFDDTIPAPPSGFVNGTFQSDTSGHLSVYVPYICTPGGGDGGDPSFVSSVNCGSNQQQQATGSDISTTFSIQTIGEGNVHFIGSHVSDVVAEGDESFSAAFTGSTDIVAIGDAADHQCENPTFTGCAPAPNPILQHDNVFIGDAAGLYNQGSDDVGIGDQSLGSSFFFTALGFYNQGVNNVAVGPQSLVGNTTGIQNTGIGAYAGSDGYDGTSTMGNANHTGSNNTWIGYDSGPNTTTQLSNTAAFGYQAHNTASNQMVLGNSSMTQAILFGVPQFPSVLSAPCLGTDGSGNIVSNPGCTGGGSFVYPSGTGVVQVVGGAAWGTTLSLQGTDSKVLTAGTVSGTGAGLCTDANGGATTAGCASTAPNFGQITTGTSTVALHMGAGGTLDTTGGGTIAATTAAALATLPTPCGTGQYASGVDTQGNAICVPLPTQPASQYIAPQAMSGCGVEYVSGLQYTIGACTYSINGVIYNSPLTNVTLAAADPSNPRIDVIFVDTTQVVQTITGTPAVSPQQPTTDPSTQLELTFVLVPAASATPGNTTLVDIYLEGVEWTGAKGGTNGTRVNLTSTSNPYSGTHDTEFGVGGTVAATTFAGYTVPSAGTVNLANYNTLTLYARNKAAWATTNSITVQWFNGTTQKGSGVVISNGAFGWNATTNTTTYQQISIPTSLFGIAGVPVTSVRFTVSGTGAALTGFYLDQITLQGGSGGPSLPATLMNFKGPWSSTATYNPNDTVTSSGVGYVALVTNTNQAVSNPAFWTPLGGSGGGGGIATANPATWPAWLIPAVTGTNLGVTATGIPLSQLVSIPANTILGAITPAVPSALSVPSCSGAANALTWTIGTGFGCNTIAGGGGGNTTSTSLTNNFLPKSNGVNSIIDSALKDDGTALTYAGSGTVGSFALGEGTAASGATGFDIFYALASTHRWTMNNNNAGALTVVGIGSAGTANDCLKLAANGIDIVDTGSTCGTGSGNVSAGGTLTSNAIILGAGTTAVAALGSLGTTTTVLHGNAAGAPTFGAVANADLANPSVTVGGATCTLGSSCTPSTPLYLNWTFNSGAAATDASPRFLASHTGTIATCYALTTASDGSTDLTFNIFDNGSTIFSGGAQTITHGTSAGTLTTLGSLGTTSITNNDKISINITSGTSSWIFTVSCK